MQQTKQGGGGSKWCSVYLITSHSDDECKLQTRQANSGNANFTMAFQQHQSTAPGKQGFQGGFSFLATTTTQEAKTIDHCTKQPSMCGTSASEREQDLNGPSIATLGLFGQTPDD